MKRNKVRTFRRHFITWLMILSVALIAFLTYKDILGYFFTGYDTLTHIAVNRIQSFSDVVRIFTMPVMHGTTFAEVNKYYRPISELSFSLDYFIWKLNPFGYHLTNLILYILVSVFIFLTIELLTNGNRITAWLSALIFTIHPLNLAIVPGIDRRERMLISLFLILALLFFIKYLFTIPRKRVFLFLSILSYVFLLGSNEMGIIFPFLIFIYLIINPFSEKKTFKDKVVQSLKECLPYFMVTFLFFVWRAYILQTFIGGGGTIQILQFKGLKTIIEIIKFVKIYFEILIHPFNYPHLSLIPRLFLIAIISLLVLLFYKQTTLQNRKIMIFLLVWLILPLGIFILTSVTFNELARYIHPSIIPFSAVFSVILVESLQSIIRKIKEYNTTDTSHYWFLIKSAHGNIISGIIIVIIIISLLLYSPLVRAYIGWRETSNISSMILHKVSEIAAQLPNDATIYLYNLPIGFSLCKYKDKPPFDNRISVLFLDYGIKSWIDLNYPNNQMKIIVSYNYEPQVNCINNLYFDTKVEKTKAIINIKYVS